MFKIDDFVNALESRLEPGTEELQMLTGILVGYLEELEVGEMLVFPPLVRLPGYYVTVTKINEEYFEACCVPVM